MASFEGLIDIMSNAWVIGKALALRIQGYVASQQWSDMHPLLNEAVLVEYSLDYPLLRWHLILYLRPPPSRILCIDMQVCRFIRRKSLNTIQNMILDWLSLSFKRLTKLIWTTRLKPNKRTNLGSHITVEQQSTMHWHFWALYGLQGEISSWRNLFETMLGLWNRNRELVVECCS